MVMDGNSNPVLTREAKYIISSWRQFKEATLQGDDGDDVIKVSETFGFLAKAYERLRSSVEYKGEHVLRRATIERMLKRIVAMSKSDDYKAEMLVKELTWSRFIPNESVSVSELKEISKVIGKLEYLLDFTSQLDDLDGVTWEEWLLGVISTELEELMVPSYLRTTLAPLMFAWLKNNFDWQTDALPAEDREIQLYIAAQRALAKSDQAILRYRLMLLINPKWGGGESDWRNSVQDLPDLAKRIEGLLNYSQSNLVFRFVNRYTSFFVVLHEVIQRSGDFQKLLMRPDRFRLRARQVIEERYVRLQGQVRNAVVRSIVYLLVTKVLIALIVEVPYELWVLGELHYLPLSINILFPPFLMFALGLSIKVPGGSNTDRILEQLNRLVYKQKKEHRPIRAKLTLTSRQRRLSKYFSLFYTFLFLGLMMLVAWFLITRLNYNFISALLFFMFLSLVLLFGYRIRWESQELTIAKHSGGVIGHVMSIVAMPFINLGAWLSSGLAQINIFMFILDVVIDAPLKALVMAFEEWGQFVQRKEEEVVDVPLQ